MKITNRIKKTVMFSFLVLFSIIAIGASVNLVTTDLQVGGTTAINTSREANFTKATIDSVVINGNDIDGGGTLDVTDNLNVTGSATVSGSATVTGDFSVDTNTLKVDSANDFVGIGISNPASPLHIHDIGADITYMQLTTTSSGTDWDDGGFIRYDSTWMEIGNFENGDVIIYANTNAWTFESDGGFNFPDKSSVASATGVQYYDSDDNMMKFYDGTAWRNMYTACPVVYYQIDGGEWQCAGEIIEGSNGNIFEGIVELGEVTQSVNVQIVNIQDEIEFIDYVAFVDKAEASPNVVVFDEFPVKDKITEKKDNMFWKVKKGEMLVYSSNLKGDLSLKVIGYHKRLSSTEEFNNNSFLEKRDEMKPVPVN